MTTASEKSANLVFFVNGKKVIDPNPDPECTLLTYLRDKLRLCGTKLGCGEGGCGACTVMLSKIDRTTNVIKHMAVNACLTPICSVHGVAVTTVEGIGSTKTRLHTVQERIAKAHGSQCGFCTPGIVMSMYALLRNLPKPSMKDMEIAFQGNLCRCTGYRPIIEGYKTLTKEFDCAMGENCCRNGTRACKQEETDEIFEKNDFVPYDPSQEPIFPPELKLHDVLDKDSITFKGPRAIWMRPTTLRELLLAKKQYPDAKIVVGNTEVGVEVKFKHMFYPVTISPLLVSKMNSVEMMGDGLKVGASVTLDNMEVALREQIKDLPEHETRIFKAIVDMLHFFAGKQVRNMAAVGGNIMTGSPISDLNPIFTAAAIELEVQSASRGRRIIHMGKGFFTGYRRNIIEQDEVLTSIILPKTNINQYFYAYKQAKRRDDDIAIVNIAVNVTFQKGTDCIDNLSISYGGMAPITLLASESCAVVKGMKWNSQFIEAINSKLINELPLDPSAPGGMIQYRRSLTLSLFFKAYLNISQQLQQRLPNYPKIDDIEKSGADSFQALPSKSVQFFEQFTENPVGRPQVHASAFKQACGEAVYCDDMPKWENELYLTPILSTKSHAKIISIDATEALQLSGVHAFYSAKDLTDDQNAVGPVFKDDRLFAKDKVLTQGQVVAAIVADNQALSQRAARMVKVVYEDITPLIISIEDAIKHNSYYPGYPKTIVQGDVDKAFKDAAYIVEGECRMGGQEHFYLETQCTLAHPKDNDEIEVFAACQHPAGIQWQAAALLGIPASKVTVRVKRLGGGFGGKEFRGLMVTLPVCYAAFKLGRPVRCMLDRDEDMLLTGQRHPFLFKYKTACDADGKITGCSMELYNNAGHSMDLSFSVMERAMLHFQNSYYIQNVKVMGWVCRTNMPSNTAFRGFGSPQAMFAAEHFIRDVARATGKPVADIIGLNLYQENQITHFNQQMENCQVRRCWIECLENSDYLNRLARVSEFNKLHRWRKRGIYIIPTTYGIAFGPLHLNQSGALVHVYPDGSVLVSHGGTEMGQGLHTKMIQVAAKVLDIPCQQIHISETGTDKVPNAPPTAASTGSDLNGMAVLNACEIINERLAPYKKQYPDESFAQWAHKAYFDRVQLSATGFYWVPDLGYNLETNSGKPYTYFVYGVGCSEVEIDCLTGDHQVIRTDIVMDLGSSINPAIDIGQIEGAFMQGYGLFTLEEMIYSPEGTLISRGPGAYKIPGFGDIPGEFNVALLTGATNPRTVFSSKAVGEPPLFLAASVFFAIKEAISAARKEEKLSDEFNLVSPATCARIRMACSDKFTEKFSEATPGSFTPWNVMP